MRGVRHERRHHDRRGNEERAHDARDDRDHEAVEHDTRVNTGIGDVVAAAEKVQLGAERERRTRRVESFILVERQRLGRITAWAGAHRVA